MTQEVHICPDGSGVGSEQEMCNEHKRLGAGWAHESGITGKAEQSQSPWVVLHDHGRPRLKPGAHLLPMILSCWLEIIHFSKWSDAS